MKGVVFLGDRKLELREFPDPTPGPRDVILEIKASGASAPSQAAAGSTILAASHRGRSAFSHSARRPRAKIVKNCDSHHSRLLQADLGSGSQHAPLIS